MATERIQMKMARASATDMDASNRLANLLGDVDKGYYPSAPADHEKADEPLWFDDDDQEHLRAFYDRVMEHVKAAPGGLFRVTFGFSTLIHNDVCDPALDVLEFHPRILAALAAVETASAPPATPATSELTDAARDVLAERQRQVSDEGWTPDHDDEHSNFEMALAASYYAIHTAAGALPEPAENAPSKRYNMFQHADAVWPWSAAWRKPADPRRNLVKAAALMLAEIERLDRAASSPTSDLAVQMYMERHMATRAEAEAFLDKCARPPAIAATDAPVGRNLEGLREQLLAPRGIVRNAEGWPVHTGARDPSGWLSHPAIPVCDEGTRVDKLLEAFSIETTFVSMESDASDFYDKWYEEGLSDCSSWVPTPPTGDGWLLLEIYDTEDGPCALFGRDFYVTEKERKEAVHAERRAERMALRDSNKEQS